MLVKDWLSVIGKALNIKVVDGNTWAYGTKESIEENYGDFELKEVEQVDDTDLLILYVSTSGDKIINSEKASFITKKKQEKDKKNATEKVYKSFLKYLNKKIKKACKKGNNDCIFDVVCANEVLDRLKYDLENMGYNVIVRGPFLFGDMYYTIRIGWEK